jgi:hypothetical protein
MLFVTQTDRGTFYAHDTSINPTLKIRCVFFSVSTVKSNETIINRTEGTF